LGERKADEAVAGESAEQVKRKTGIKRRERERERERERALQENIAQSFREREGESVCEREREGEREEDT
jgi:hypothetical protein